MSGITLKQYAKFRFMNLCEEQQRIIDEGLNLPGNMAKFIVLSLKIHAAKGEVPKYMWRLAKINYQKNHLTNHSKNV
jgi:hypothetical protein